MPFIQIQIPNVIRIDIPALTDLVGFLREIDKRDQQAVQSAIDSAASTLRQSDDDLASGIATSKSSNF